VKQAGFKPGVKKRGVMDEQSGESKEGEVMGEGKGESKMEELVPGWYSQISKWEDVMRSLIMSQWRQCKMGAIWQDFRALMTVRAREFWICWKRDNWDLGSL